MKKSIWAFIIIIVIACLALLVTIQMMEGDEVYLDTARPPITDVPHRNVDMFSCEDAGGTWNECGSACRTEPDEAPCILMCVQYCECQGDDQCPAGHSCVDYVEETGVCEIF
jgi:hypothetical protein